METGDIAAHMGIGERMVRRYISRALEHARLRVDEASSHTYM
jgi:DNA-directed RNA polymerase specialized sigma24 family protein